MISGFFLTSYVIRNSLMIVIIDYYLTLEPTWSRDASAPFTSFPGGYQVSQHHLLGSTSGRCQLPHVPGFSVHVDSWGLLVLFLLGHLLGQVHAVPVAPSGKPKGWEHSSLSLFSLLGVLAVLGSSYLHVNFRISWIHRMKNGGEAKREKISLVIFD